MQAPVEQVKTSTSHMQWTGDYFFLLENLLLKDFKIRYRNMSLGLFWSLLNPLVMMGVLWFIFTQVFPNNTIPHFSVFVLCGLVPFNFFTLSWLISTTSLADNAGLIKRLTVPREIIPISAVLSNCIHLGIQIGLLLSFTLASGIGLNIHWLWLPYICACEIVFVTGLGLMFSVFNVYVRDTRYVVESANTVLFWLVPIFYSFAIIPAQFREAYQLNPLAAIVFSFRNILLDGIRPATSLLVKLTLSSVIMLLIGVVVFRLLRKGLYDHL
jgi:ABC-type polysaccharide/polyol phosphate export permease